MVVRWLALSVCILVLIAGCGGDSDNGDDGADTSDAAPTATTQDAAQDANAEEESSDEGDSNGGDGAVEFQVVRGARPNSTADVVVRAAPNASCEITYTTPDGDVGEMRGLEPKTATGVGRVSWGWKIDPDTTPGEGTVSVTCDGSTAETALPIH